MKASTIKPAAAKQAELNMADMIDNVQPDINWVNFAAKLAVSCAYGVLIGACFSMLTSALIVATSSTLLIVLGYAILVAAMIFIAVTTTQLVADAIVDTLPKQTGAAINAAKAWFNSKRDTKFVSAARSAEDKASAIYSSLKAKLA